MIRKFSSITCEGAISTWAGGREMKSLSREK
jgi:hypothetical protein